MPKELAVVKVHVLEQVFVLVQEFEAPSCPYLAVSAVPPS
jgi:hypothetical protein